MKGTENAAHSIRDKAREDLASCNSTQPFYEQRPDWSAMEQQAKRRT
jgi:hypothetical protein